MSLIKENGQVIISDDNYFNTDENAYGEGYVTRETLLFGEYRKPLGDSLKELSEVVTKYGDKVVLNVFAAPGFSDFDGFGGDYVPHFQIVRPSTEDEIKEFKEYVRAQASPNEKRKECIKRLEEELKRLKDEMQTHLKEETVDEDGVKEHFLTKPVEAFIYKTPLEEQPVMILPSEPIIKKEKTPTTKEMLEFSKKLSTAFDMTTVYAEQQKKLEEDKLKRTPKVR